MHPTDQRPLSRYHCRIRQLTIVTSADTCRVHHSSTHALADGITPSGIKPACDALGVSRATVYRRLSPGGPSEEVVEPRRHHHALTDAERQGILDVVHGKRFRDSSVREIYGTLLSEGVYLASVSTLYRILRASSGTRERRNVRTRSTMTGSWNSTSGPTIFDGYWPTYGTAYGGALYPTYLPRGTVRVSSRERVRVSSWPRLPR